MPCAPATTLLPSSVVGVTGTTVAGLILLVRLQWCWVLCKRCSWGFLLYFVWRQLLTVLGVSDFSFSFIVLSAYPFSTSCDGSDSIYYADSKKKKDNTL